MRERADWSVHTAAVIEDDAGRWLRTCHAIWTVRNETRDAAEGFAVAWAADEALACHLMTPARVGIDQTIRFPRKDPSGAPATF